MIFIFLATLCVYKQYIFERDKMRRSLFLCFMCLMCSTEAFVMQGNPHSQSKPVMPLLCQSQNARLSAVAGCLRLASPLLVDDVSMGEKILSLNYAACHAGVQSSVVFDHTLNKVAIEKYMTGGFNEKSVVYQVTHAKKATPVSGICLADEYIGNVAAYVIKTAEDSWD